MKTLVRHGVDINAITLDSGNTPLHLALKNKHHQVVRYLMSQREIKMIRNYEGKYPEYYAKIEGNEEIYHEFFHDRLIDLVLNNLDSSNLTSLLSYYGSSSGCLEISDLLNHQLIEGFTLGDLGHLMKHQGLITLASQENYQSFWKDFCSHNLENPDIKLLTDKIKSNYQTKLLLDMTLNKNDLAFNQNNNFEEKMNLSDFTTETLSKDIKIYSEIQPMMTFKNKIDKTLKINNFESKIITINNLIKNNLLNAEEIYCIALLSNDIFVNELNKQVLNYHESSEWAGYLSNLSYSLTKLPPFTGECYRKINKFFYMPTGTEISWNSFGFTTNDWGNVGMDKKSTIFIIKSKTGREIHQYSSYQQNKEVVFFPKTKFRITNYYQNNIVVLGQPNVRQSSYLATESDYQKVKDKKVSLIVELTEI